MFAGYLNFCFAFLVMCKNGFNRKKGFVSKCITSQPGKHTIAIHILPNISRTKQSHGKLFYGWGWVKMSATIVAWQGKIWLKWFKAVPSKKLNLDQSIKDSKSHIWNYFFWKYFIGFGHTTFYIGRHVPVDIIRAFFTFYFNF